MTFRHQLSILTLALAAALPMTLPTVVQAQPSSTSAAVGISSIGVEQVRRLRPGNVLAFTLNGTPRSRVSLQIAGASEDVQMTERQPGLYEGNYTIRQRDRLNAGSLVTARVVKDGQIATATLSRSLVIGARDPAPPPVATQITAFTITAPDRPRPGDELSFKMNGTPGGTATVAIQGLPTRVALRETSRGVYEGSYVLRRQDRLRGELVADGYLVSNRREAKQRFEREMAREANQAAREDARTDARRDARDDAREAREARDRQQAAAFCGSCGSVESVNLVEVNADSPNVIGTIAGGLLGGVIGHQVGGGSGKDIATVIGAVGGAYAGNRVENNMGKRKVFRVLVRLEGGSTQSFDYADDPAVRVGTRVKVENNNLVRL